MYLCDVPAGSIVCFKGSANYWMKVKDLNGIWGVINLYNGIILDAKTLRQKCGIDPDTCYVVTKTVNELYTEGV